MPQIISLLPSVSPDPTIMQSPSESIITATSNGGDGLASMLNGARIGETTSDKSIRPPLYFSAELHGAIIGVLWNNSRALKSCALVSKAWCTSVRKHLFHNVAIFLDNEKQFTALYRILTTSPYIIPFVKSLSSKGIPCSTNDPNEHTCSPEDAQIYANILRLLTHVQSFHISNRRGCEGSWSHATEDFQDAVNKVLQLSTLSSLNFIGCSMVGQYAAQFNSVLLRAPRIKKLLLDEVTIGKDILVATADSASPGSGRSILLQELILHPISARSNTSPRRWCLSEPLGGNIRKWLLLPNCPLSLKGISFLQLPISIAHEDETAQLLEEIGSSLEYAHFHPSKTTKDSYCLLNFSHNSGLRSLRVDLDRICSRVPFADRFPSLIQTLSTIPSSNCLQRLELTCQANTDAWSREQSWSPNASHSKTMREREPIFTNRGWWSLGELLSQDKFSALQRVEIKIACEDPYGADGYIRQVKSALASESASTRGRSIQLRSMYRVTKL